MVHLDLVSLTLQFELGLKELRRLREDLRTQPARRDLKAILLESQLLHERAHLTSFLGSNLAKVHRKILDRQLYLAQCILREVHQSRLLDGVTVPLLDRHGRLFPNALAPHPKLKVDVAARGYHELDALNQFVMGYPPACEWETLMRAYQQLLSTSALVQQPDGRLLHNGFSYIGSSRDTGETLCFMREHHCLATIPQICNVREGFGALPPVVPKIHVHDVPGSDAPMLLSSRSVLEGLAVLGEVIGMRERHAASMATARSAMPAAYKTALVYCLHCINRASGERYTLGQLFSGHLPDWVDIAMGAMLDLAIQIEVPEPPASNHSVLIEKCPAWRLLLIGASVKAGDVPLINPGAAFDGHEIRDWHREVCMRMGWKPLDRRPTAAATQSRPWPRKDVTGADLFEHLTDVAAILRDRHQLSYLTGRNSVRDGEWLDFIAWETRDRQRIFLTDAHIQARRDFITIQGHRHYATPALVFGRHWDHWWQQRRVRIPQRHTSHIAQRLNHALQTHPQFGRLPPESGQSFVDDEIRVREEFSHVSGCDRVN